MDMPQTQRTAPEMYHTASRVLMIRPKSFAYHSQAASSNTFMHQPDADETSIADAGLAEFDRLANTLKEAGIDVIIHQDTQGLPDCLFPNNWLSFHHSEDNRKSVITYPMCDELRRLERAPEILELVASIHGQIDHLDLAELEIEGEILEGTGSMVLDRTRGLAFACRSPRTTEDAFDTWSDETGYETILFTATDPNDNLIYHTNVMMSLGKSFAVCCLDAIKDPEERTMVSTKILNSGRALIEITPEQMNNFCGNILELINTDDNSILIMSSRSYHAFTQTQIGLLEEFAKIIHVPVPTIEDVGGGGVRCMIAELGR